MSVEGMLSVACHMTLLVIGRASIQAVKITLPHEIPFWESSNNLKCSANRPGKKAVCVIERGSLVITTFWL